MIFSDKTIEEKAKYRIVYSSSVDKKRHTIFANNDKDLTEKIINISGALLSITTNPTTSLKDVGGLIESRLTVLKELYKDSNDSRHRIRTEELTDLLTQIQTLKK